MSSLKTDNQTYFDLAEHNTLQIFVFYFFLFFCLFLVFISLLPALEFIFSRIFEAKVYNNGDQENIEFIKATGNRLYDFKEKLPHAKTHYYFKWAIDMYETRYWFEPLISLIVPTTILSLSITTFVSTLLPSRLGFIRQKIEREIVNTLDKIFFYQNGYHSESGYREIASLILQADMRELQHLSEQWKTPLEDLRVLYKALKWSSGSFLYRLFHINDSFTMYMRFYFTVRYSNTVLGFVYIGAAVLIIIIGLRGLKFIPSTKPSLVFFALGLEFSLLIIYAFTLMYSRQDEETEPEKSTSAKQESSLLLSGDFGNAKEVENLLRVFVRSKKEISRKKQ